MICKNYIEALDSCMFDGCLDDCPYKDNRENCNCYKPYKEEHINGNKNN